MVLADAEIVDGGVGRREADGFDGIAARVLSLLARSASKCIRVVATTRVKWDALFLSIAAKSFLDAGNASTERCFDALACAAG